MQRSRPPMSILQGHHEKTRGAAHGRRDDGECLSSRCVFTYTNPQAERLSARARKETSQSIAYSAGRSMGLGQDLLTVARIDSRYHQRYGEGRILASGNRKALRAP